MIQRRVLQLNPHSSTAIRNKQRMGEHDFHGEIVVKELITEHLEAVEKLLDAPPTTEAIPEELTIEAPAEEAPMAEAPAAEAPAADQAEKAS